MLGKLFAAVEYIYQNSKLEISVHSRSNSETRSAIDWLKSTLNIDNLLLVGTVFISIGAIGNHNSLVLIHNHSNNKKKYVYDKNINLLFRLELLK